MNSANPLASAAPLIWTQSKSMSRQYQLKSGDTLIGNLGFEKASGSRASAEVTSQRWTFKREGFFHPRVTVRVPDSDVNVAVFHPQWSSGGNLDFPDGHQLRWRCTNFWGSHWAFVHADNRPSILFRHHEGILKASAELEIDPADTSLPDLPLLVVLGWYLIILSAEDAAAVIVSSAVVS